jgi:hypothetical protein
MATNTWSARGHLDSLGIDHSTLSQQDVVTLSYSLHGWPLRPATAAGAPPIAARVWLAAALNTCGRYQAPERDGHPAELEDGGPLVDSMILMAIVQRHFLTAHAPGWDDSSLARALGLPSDDFARAQRVLEDALTLPLRGRRVAPLGSRWWDAA